MQRPDDVSLLFPHPRARRRERSVLRWIVMWAIIGAVLGPLTATLWMWATAPPRAAAIRVLTPK